MRIEPVPCVPSALGLRGLGGRAQGADVRRATQGGICLAGRYALVREQPTTGQLPSHAMRSALSVVDLDPAGPAAGIHAAEPEVVLARPVNETLEALTDLQPFGPIH